MFHCRNLLIVLLPLIVLGATARLPAADDWPAWRGPTADNKAAPGQQIPVTWSNTEHVLWKTPVPGRGHSSPVVVGDRIFLATADEATQQQSVVAFSRTDGRLLWQTPISQGGFPKTHPKNTHATCTVACDGERLFVAFHHHAKLTLTALNVDGSRAWEELAGPYDPKVYEYGYAPSPVIYKDTVIIAADVEKGGYLAAYDRVTGKRAWRTPRTKMLSFSSPIVAHVGGRDQLLLSGCDFVAGYNPATGKGLWTVPGTSLATCGTMVWDGDFVFASGGYPKSETICVNVAGKPTALWKNNAKCYEQSMLAHEGYLYAVTDQGVAYCWRGADGEEMWRERLAGPISASPVLNGTTIYATNEAGSTFVFQADPSRFELLARNQLEEEAFASLAICGNRIYTRVASGQGAARKEHLYCLGE